MSNIDIHDINAAELFQKELEEYLKEYETVLAKMLKSSTISKHSNVIDTFIEFLCGYHTVTGLEQITLGMAGSRFTRYFNSHTDEGLQTVTVKNILYRYFVFIADTYGLVNPKLLQQLAKKKR